MRLGLIAIAVLLLAACGPTDRQLVGRYRIQYVDTFDDMSMRWCNDDGGCAGDGLPGPQLIAAGYDEKYVVATVHPYDGHDKPDTNITEFYYVIRAFETNNGQGLPYKGIRGPLTESEFWAAKTRLHLPEFTWHIEDEY